MAREWQKRIQITLIVFFVIAIIRVAMIYYARKESGEAGKPRQPVSSYKVTEDDYVTPPKVFPYDARSAAKELAGKTVWVRSGNQIPYYRYTNHHADIQHKQGLLAPLQKLTISDVIAQPAPALTGGSGRAVMAVFTPEGEKSAYAAAVGTEQNGTYNFYINDVFFLADPHTLYAHWPAEVWQAIDRHEAKPGMNELQVGFALGVNAHVGSGDYGNRTNEYLTADKAVKVTFEKNKATEIVSEKPEKQRLLPAR